MRILRLKADGFGPLRAEYRFDPGRVALVLDDNERGKSSLLAAITAALYGLQSDRRTNRLLTPVDRWRPWDGGTYRIELEFESGGSRYLITRDFGLGLTGVWNGDGDELTHDFREGRDQFPVGKKLFGLEAEEFEKCAFVRQGELDHVVPDEERARRSSTLHARLEAAADTPAGDSSATEALQALDEAAAKYTCPELATTLRIETAIQRLEAKRELLATEIRTLEHDQAGIATPLEELARTSERERQLRSRLSRTESDRRSTQAVDASERLEQDDARRAELAHLRADAESLAAYASVPWSAEADLQTTLARLEEAKRALEPLEEREKEAGDARAPLTNEAQTLDRYAWCTPHDADRLVQRATLIRRLDEELERRRTEYERQRDALAEGDVDLDRALVLTARFSPLSTAHITRLTQHRELELSAAEIGSLEQQKRDHADTIRAIDEIRASSRTPGWVVWIVGIAAGATGGVLATREAEQGVWVPLVVVGVALALVGMVLLAAAGRSGRAKRAEAVERLAEIEGKLDPLKRGRDESGTGLRAIAETLAYPRVEDMLAEWHEYSKTQAIAGPVLQAKREHSEVERQRDALIVKTRRSLDTLGGGVPEPAALEAIAEEIRRSLALRGDLASSGNELARAQRDRATALSAVQALEDRAKEILESAGLEFDEARTWVEQAADVGARAQGAQRRALLIDEEIPRLEKLLLDDAARDGLRAVVALAAEAGEPAAEPEPTEGTPSAYGTVVTVRPRDKGGAPDPAAGTADLERESERVRTEIDELGRRREDLRIKVEETSRRYGVAHPEKCAELEQVDSAIERARRFQAALELSRRTIEQVASDTHRRWAEFLNARVGELIGSLGTGITQIRFGDDLEFSVRLPSGQQVPRGKALLQLSSGARDQLHLAVRLAISEFLSRGGVPLPLLIDDCFATSDDTRAAAAMRLLLQRLSNEHQIVIATCHRARYKALAALDPELYEAKVQWLETRPVESESRP